MRISKTIFIAAGLVLALAGEGHVGVTALKKMTFPEIVAAADFIVIASPLQPFAVADTLAFPDPTAKIPALPRRAWRSRLGRIIKNAEAAALPETLLVLEANTESHALGHLLAHTMGEVQPPIAAYYQSPVKEANLAKRKSLILFLSRKKLNSSDPSEWLEFVASGSYENASKAKAVANAVVKSLPKPAAPSPNRHK